jgi:hypothetical protein
VEKRSSSPVGWVIGCLLGLCLLLGVAGIGALALNNSNLNFLRSATSTTVPTILPTEAVIAPIATNTLVPLPTETFIPIGNTTVLLEDNFSISRDKWGTITDTDSSVEYKNDSLHMQLFQKNYVVWSRPNDDDYENVHVEVTAINNDTDSMTAFGIFCFQQGEDWSFYYLAMTPAGEYAVIRATEGEDDVYLTNDGKWETSHLIPVNADTYRVGADCGNGTLTLFVVGQLI